MSLEIRRWLSAAACAVLLSFPALALPTGSEVTTGNATVQTSGNKTTIVQSGDRTIIHWNGFSIGLGESVQFIQPSALSAVLNRVVGADPSVILGSLSANGQVFLVNPNGVFFGQDAQVDVGSLLVTTLGISDQDFLAGNHQFTQHSGTELAAIVNQGTLRVQDNGFLILAAPHISNEGLLVANQGNIALLAGEQAAVSFDGSGLLNFQVAELANDKSTVLMPNSAASEILEGVVSSPGIAEGTELAVVDGQLQLIQGSGTLINSGTILAEGGEAVLNSSRATVVTAQSQQSASRALVLSEGQAAALPGAKVDIGEQGFAELSGQHIIAGLTVEGQGTYLIDPTTLTIEDGPLPAVPAADTVYEEALEASAVPVVLVADENIVVNDIADNEITLANDVSLFLSTSTADVDSVSFEDENDRISTQGVGEIEVDVAGNIASGIFESEAEVTLSAQDIGGEGEPVAVISPVLSLTATGDVDIETEVDGVAGTVGGDLELTEEDAIELAGLSATGDVIINANSDITGDNPNAPDVSGDNVVLISTLGTIGSDANPLDVDVGGDLLVSAGGQVNGASVTLDGTVDGSAAVSAITPGSAELDGEQLDISTDPDFDEELFDDLVDLTGEFDLDEADVEDLLEELGTQADQADHDGFGPEGFDTEGPDHPEPGENEDFETDGEGDDFEPDGDGEEFEPDGTDPEDPDHDDGEDNEKDGGKKTRGSRTTSIPYVAQAGLNRQLNTQALMAMDINRFQSVRVRLGQPSPFDAALASSSLRLDNILELETSDLNNFNVFLSYDINKDPVLTNPDLSAGDMFELGTADLGDVPVSLQY